MKKNQKINAIAFAILAVVLSLSTVLVWAGKGCSTESLVIAVLFYMSMCSVAWAFVHLSLND